MIFSVKDIRWSLPKDRELDSFIGDGAGVGKGLCNKWVYFVFVQFHAVKSMNCYHFVYVDKNQEWWPFSLECIFTSFSCSQKHLSRFHFKTMWYHLCFPLPANHVKPLKNWSCYGILLIFDQLVGCDSWYGHTKEHTWWIVQPWKGLNSTTVILKSPWIWFRSLKSTWFLY